MPDLTDKILAEITPDPLYNPLLPTVEKLEDYDHNVNITLKSLNEAWRSEIKEK